MNRYLAMALCWLCSQVPVRLMAEVDFKLPYPEGRTYRVSQGNRADTSGDQRPDAGGTHGCFTENSQSCNPLERFAFDFAMPEDSTVVAAADGVVKFVRNDSNTGGCSSSFKNDANYIVIDHSDGTSTLYLHLKPDSVLVAVGDAVWRGQAIAKSGQTGWACGAHLHFQRQNQSSSSWYTNTIAVAFSDVSENGGVPIAGSWYTSGNWVPVPTTPIVPIAPIDLTTTRIVFRSDRNDNPGLYLMDADGTNITLLLPNPADDVIASDPVWSPDGKKIALTYKDLGIYTVNADGTNLTFLSEGRDPAWSPDGQKIAFESNRDIYLTDVNGTHVINLTPSGPPRSVRGANPTWSPDGQRIAYLVGFPTQDVIYVMDTNGIVDFIPRRPTISAEIFDLAWSPDGGKFVVETGFFSERYIYVMDVDGKNAKNLGYGNKPAWSPDGKKLVFAWYHDYRHWDIYVIDADGGNRTRLTDNPTADDYAPSWSPSLSSSVPPTLTRVNIHLAQTAGGEVISNKLLSVRARTVLTFTADGTASDNSGMTITPAWRVAGSIGSITPEGRFTAGTKAGNWGYVVVSAEGISDSIQVTILPGSLNRLRISPSFVTLSPRQKITFGAQGTDAYGNPIQGLRVFWYHVGNIGTINKLTGLFTAGLNPGTGYVIAFAGSANDSVITDGAFGNTRARGSGSAKVVVVAELPATYALSQNYPNPFNPETSINYSLPEMATTRLTVYNLSGQTVRTLVYDAHHPPGNYTAVWDGRDDIGQAVSSGVYFYRLEAVDRGFAESKRMLLVR